MRSDSSNDNSWGAPLAAAVLAVALYAVTVGGTFVYDDRFIAHDDPRLHDGGGWKRYWVEGYRPGAADHLWRPLTSLSYWAQWQLFGGTAWGMHGVNVLLHAGVCAGVAVLGRRLAGARAGWVAGLMFAAHPVHVEAVAYVVGRAETLCALGTVGAMALAARRPMTRWRAAAVFACSLVALFSKEQGLFAPVLVAGAWWATRERGDAAAVTSGERTAVKGMVVLFVWCWAAYGVYRERILPWHWDMYFLDWTINPLVRAVGWDRWLIPVALLGRCAGLLVAPWRLSPEYGMAVIAPRVAWGEPYLYVGVAALGVWGALMWRAWRRGDRVVLFGLVGLAVAWFPASNVIRIGTVFGERLIYLPSVFFVLLVARWVAGVRPRVLWPVLGVVLVLFSLRTVTYARRWNDRVRFYEVSLAEQPRSAQLRLLVVDELQAAARAARERGDEGAARAALSRAAGLLEDGRRIVPDYDAVWTESAETSFELGDVAAADQFVRRAEELAPGMPAVTYWRERVEAARARGTR